MYQDKTSRYTLGGGQIRLRMTKIKHKGSKQPPSSDMSSWFGWRVMGKDDMEWFPEQLGCLADQWGLLQGDEDRAHAGHIFSLLAGLWVEVAEPCHALPLCAWVVLIQIWNHGFLSRPVMRQRGGKYVEERAISAGSSEIHRYMCSPEKDLC